MSGEVDSSWKELGVLVLGWHDAGKTSVINTLLGSSKVFGVTGQCVKRDGDIDGKKVSLIDTPGWWKGSSLGDSAEFTKLELVRSLSLCSFGPHAFLLVVEVNLAVTEKTLNRLVQHVELLGDNVWDHTIVIFTKEDLLKNMTVDQRIQNGGEALKSLLEKCGGRYHAFSNASKGNLTQISELIQKIEEMIRKNDGRKLKINLDMLQEVQNKWADMQIKANARQSRVPEERATIKEKAYVHQLEELRVVLLGWVMSGKSSAGNIILNREAFKTGNRTTTCERQYGNVAGRQMTVLDTAGWWKFFSSKLNPEWVKSTGFESVTQCKKFPHAFLLVLPADTAFKEEQRRIIEDNMAIFGEHIWRHTIVLFTWGDLLGDVMIEQHIEHESELQWLIEKCGNRYHVFDNTKKNNRSQVTELLEKIEEMVAANCLYRFDTPGVPKTLETKTEKLLDTCGEDVIEAALRFVVTEWNSRAVNLREKLEKELAEEMELSTFKSDRSIDAPLEFRSKSFDEGNVGPGDARRVLDTKQTFRSMVSENMMKQVMSDFDREWCRQEAFIMENVNAVLLRASSETSSVSEKEIQASLDKVMWWIPRMGEEVEFAKCKNLKRKTRSSLRIKNKQANF